MEIVRIAVAIPAFIGAFFFTGKAIYHMFYVVTNITGKNASLLSPFVLLMPSQFNTLGNQHRVALGPSLLGIAVCWVLLFVSGALNHS